MQKAKTGTATWKRLSRRKRKGGELQAGSISSQKKGVIVAFEDETTIIQKPCIHKSLSFEGEQQKIEHNGSRRKFSAYISMVWSDEKLIYDFYDKMNSMNTIDHLENLKTNITKNDWWKRLILIWDNTWTKDLEGGIMTLDMTLD